MKFNKDLLFIQDLNSGKKENCKKPGWEWWGHCKFKVVGIFQNTCVSEKEVVFFFERRVFKDLIVHIDIFSLYEEIVPNTWI